MRPMKSFTRNRRRKFIESYEYAPDFINKLEGELGDRATALRALDGLDAWFIARLHAENRMIGMPSKIVDVAWHEFILRTREYTNFCDRAFGAYLHHTPDSTMKISATSLLPATLEIAERHAIPMVLFTADEDSGYRLEVNLSGKSIGDPELPELIEREIAATGVDPGRLVFEITETAAIANMDLARSFAERLRKLGCRFALDDFGAGFSSFYYLKHLPLDYVKIDGDFIRNLAGSLTDQLVVKSIVDIARGMGMKTIAEFVENAETVEMLREKGVDYSQGYHHGRPEPMRRLEVARVGSL